VKRRPEARAGSPPRGEAAPEDAERFLPEDHGPIPAYEHAHRYALAASTLEGRRVLDLACGAGYGTRILRAAGAEVVALDLDAACVRGVGAPALRARAERLPFRDASFEAVVCFETIEHVPEPARVLDEIARVLARSGVAFVSTPDRALYTGRAGNRNPHHLAELDRAELTALLRERFAHFELFGQSVWAGSWLARLEGSGAARAAGERQVETLRDPLAVPARRTPPPWVDPAEDALPTPLFLVAVCARDAAGARRVKRAIRAQSVLHDPTQWLLGHYLESLHGVVARDHEIQGFATHARDLQALVAERDERVAKLEHHARNLEALRAEQDGLLAGARAHASNLEELLAAREQRVADLEDHARQLGEHVAALQDHARGLEERVRERAEHLEGVERHARNLEGLTEGLRQHATNLEKLVAEREAHLAGVEAHARNLEDLRARHEDRIGSLEAGLRALDEDRAGLRAELERLRASAGYRALRRLGLVDRERP
jgi:SAM-dependent methyltransferase